MKIKRAEELRLAWGDAPCGHEKLAKLYDGGERTGSFACTQCGKTFTFREKVELRGARED